MREILFRGKRTKTGEWVSGLLWHHTEKASSIYSDELDKHVWVHPETVGQFTGLTDKNGRKAFEHDVIMHHFSYAVGVIKYGEYRNPWNDDSYTGHVGFYVDWVTGEEHKFLRKDLGYWLNTTQIVGNIHDNPELLENP